MQTCIIFPISVHTEGISVWTVFFMIKRIKCIGICFLLAASVWCGTVIADRQRLHQELVRLHIVANSDTEEDQSLKLRVRDAILESIQDGIRDIKDPEQARVYLQEKLPKIRTVAEETITKAGFSFPVSVGLKEEAFPIRDYDTFRLPSGVYQSLRIVIGDGEGHNWWCVVFPTLCAPATVEGFEETAECADFSDALTAALEGREAYELRFYFLDALGRLENFLFAG